MKDWDRNYDSYIDFYQDAYGSVMSDVRKLPFEGVTFKANQSKGDWSDAAVPDLVFCTNVRGAGKVSADFGAGRFNGNLSHYQTVSVPPHSATSIQCTGRHELRVLAVPYANLIVLAGDDVALPGDGDFGALHARPLQDSFFTDMVSRIWQSAAINDSAHSLFAEGVLMSLVATLSRTTVKTTPVRAGLAPWQIRRVEEAMSNPDNAAISLKALAQSVGLSTFHFARAFKAATGLPPYISPAPETGARL